MLAGGHGQCVSASQQNKWFEINISTRTKTLENIRDVRCILEHSLSSWMRDVYTYVIAMKIQIVAGVIGCGRDCKGVSVRRPRTVLYKCSTSISWS